MIRLILALAGIYVYNNISDSNVNQAGNTSSKNTQQVVFNVRKEVPPRVPQELLKIYGTSGSQGSTSSGSAGTVATPFSPFTSPRILLK